MKKNQNLFSLIIVLGCFFYMGSVWRIIFTALGFDLASFSNADLAYANVLIGLVTGLVICFIYKKTLIRDWRSFRKNTKENLKSCLKLFLVLFGLKFGAAFISSLLAMGFGIEMTQSENQNVLDALTGSAPLMMFISTVIIAPFIEEGIFRLGVKKIIKDTNWFIVISGLIFGLMHVFPTVLTMEAIIQSIVYVVMGLGLAWIYESEKNIYFPIMVHALNNLVSVLAFLFLT